MILDWFNRQKQFSCYPCGCRDYSEDWSGSCVEAVEAEIAEENHPIEIEIEKDGRRRKKTTCLTSGQFWLEDLPPLREIHPVRF